MIRTFRARCGLRRLRAPLGGALLAAVALLHAAGARAAEKRVALVIGNSAYASAPLTNPRNDAQLIAATLRRVGFDVELHLDATQKEMKRAISSLGARMEQAGAGSVGLFYYAGHGVQVAGENYLVPVDAQISHERDVGIESVPASDVTDVLGYAKSQVMIVILDACRDNPFPRATRSAAGGLAKMEAPAGTLIAYATSPGDVALDGAGLHSPYTEALSRAIQEPGLPIELAFKETRRAVLDATQSRQTPWEHSSLTGDFAFVPGPRAGASAASEDPEVVYWRSVEGSGDPAAIEGFLKRFPNGALADLARMRLGELRAGADKSLNRQRIAYSKELDVEVFAEYAELQWCAPQVRLRVEAGDPAVFERPAFATLATKLSKALSRECPIADTADLRGFRRGSNVESYRGAMSAAQKWELHGSR